MRVYTVLGIDLVLTLIFTIIGRASHGEPLSLAGIVETAWPFLTAVIVGSLLAQWAGGPWWRQGLIVWPVTVALGLILRVASGRTAAFGFIVVTTVVLALFLLGWRFVVRRRL